MYQGKSVAVVIPCYREETQIGGVLATLPEYVDKAIVVDDASPDGTANVVESCAAAAGSRIELMRHERNAGKGAALMTGFRRCLEIGSDIVVVMDGDGQMDPAEMPRLLEPLVSGGCDFTKANRLASGEAWHIVPRVRYLGNSGLTLLTKVASGYWHVSDSQAGYIAMTRSAVASLHARGLYHTYGVPNDILVKLNIENFRVRDVPMRPVYGVGEKSKLKPFRAMPKMAWLVFRLFWYRMFHKYVVRDFHPLIFFWMLGSILLLSAAGFFVRLLVLWWRLGHVPEITALAMGISIISGLQSIFFALHFDMEANRELK